jgi:hypothetical protein
MLKHLHQVDAAVKQVVHQADDGLLQACVTCHHSGVLADVHAVLREWLRVQVGSVGVSRFATQLRAHAEAKGGQAIAHQNLSAMLAGERTIQPHHVAIIAESQGRQLSDVFAELLKMAVAAEVKAGAQGNHPPIPDAPGVFRDARAASAYERVTAGTRGRIPATGTPPKPAAAAQDPAPPPRRNTKRPPP